MNTGDYTSAEWLQIAAFLVGMPVAAIFGAMLGLAGKWKQGRVVSAAVLGLGGAALGAVILLGLIWRALPFDQNSNLWLPFFEEDFGVPFTFFVLLATAVISLLAAIGLRARGAAQKATSISLRQLLLIQVFVLVVLGCWTGMRFAVLSRTSDFDRAFHRWTKQQWQVVGSSFESPTCLLRNFEGQPIDAKRESALLYQAAAEPWLEELQLYGLDKADALDFDAVAQAGRLKKLSLSYSPSHQPPQSQIDAIGKLKSLLSLRIEGGDFSQCDLSPLAQLPALKMIEIEQATLDIPALQKCLIRRPVEHLYLAQIQSPTSPRQMTVTFGSRGGSLGLLTLICETTVNEADLLWAKPSQINRLHIDGPSMTNEAAGQIAALPNLTSLRLQCQINETQLELLAQLESLEELDVSQAKFEQDRDAFIAALRRIALQPKLKRIECSDDFLPMARRPKITEALPSAFDRLAFEALRKERIEFEEQINAERANANLQPLRFRIDAQGVGS